MGLRMKIRPQILTAIILLASLGGFGIFLGMNEVATATIGGIIGLGFKLLESE